MILKVTGLVVRESAVGESDKYLTLLTPEHGKMFIRARGVRKLRSKHISSTQLLSYSEFTLFKSTNFISMNEAVLIENFYNIRLDIEKFALASYVVDIASTLSVEEADDGLLPLVLNTLYALAHTDKLIPLVKSAFEIRAMTVSGFMPELHSCVKCGETITASCAFDASGGGVVCVSCQSAGTAHCNAEVLSALRYITESPSERLFSFTLHDEAAENLSAISERFALEQLGCGFTTLEFYKNVMTLPK